MESKADKLERAIQEEVAAGNEYRGEQPEPTIQRCYLCCEAIQPGESIAPTKTNIVTHQKCADRASRD